MSDLTAVARDALLPWHVSRNDDPTSDAPDTYMRKCIDAFYCGGTGPITADRSEDGAVWHGPNCRVSPFLATLDADRLRLAEIATDAYERLDAARSQPEPSRVLRDAVGRYIVAVTRRATGGTTDAEVGAAYKALYDAATLPDRPTRVEPGDLEVIAREFDVAVIQWRRAAEEARRDGTISDVHGHRVPAEVTASIRAVTWEAAATDLRLRAAAASLPAETPVDQEEPE